MQMLFSREVLQEDDEGSLQATIDDIVQKAKRKRSAYLYKLDGANKLLLIKK